MMLKRSRLSVLATAIGLVAVAAWFVYDAAHRPIRVGILHSLSGGLAASEKPVADATLYAIEEINAHGGVLGRKIEPIVVDGASDDATFARAAERLIVKDKVATLFGCWTSSCRKAVKAVVERHHHLLYYPIQYEGLEASPDIVYLGATPNQQVIPALKWVLGTKGRRIFLVGSDYVYPRAANAIIRDQVRLWRGEIVGEAYIPLDSDDVGPVVRAIVRQRPDAVLNTINGRTNIAFFRALRKAGMGPDKMPVVSFSISESELGEIGADNAAGDFVSWGYFQSLKNPRNAAFVAGFKKRYGADRTIGAPMATAYTGVYLWKRAVEAADSADVAAIRAEAGDKSFSGPGGMVYVDPESRNCWKTMRIGRIRPDGQIETVWSENIPVRPEPYPATRSKEAWNRLLEGLKRRWHGHWAAPKAPVPNALNERRGSPD